MPTCMLCKERLDGLMKQFKQTRPGFYNVSHAARGISTRVTRKPSRRRLRERGSASIAILTSFAGARPTETRIRAVETCVE